MARGSSRGHLLPRILSMQRELNDLLRKTFGPDPFAVDFDPERWERWMPPADLYVRNGGWIARVDLPEVDLDEISLSIVDNHLLIEGERKPPQDLTPEQSILRECPYGPFERVIHLPSPVPEDKIQVRYERGVLYITLPAAEVVELEGRKIEVESDEPPEEEEEAA